MNILDLLLTYYNLSRNKIHLLTGFPISTLSTIANATTGTDKINGKTCKELAIVIKRQEKILTVTSGLILDFFIILENIINTTEIHKKNFSSPNKNKIYWFDHITKEDARSNIFDEKITFEHNVKIKKVSQIRYRINEQELYKAFVLGQFDLLIEIFRKRPKNDLDMETIIQMKISDHLDFFNYFHLID